MLNCNWPFFPWKYLTINRHIQTAHWNSYTSILLILCYAVRMFSMAMHIFCMHEKPKLIMFQSESNIFRNLPTEQYKIIREGIIKYYSLFYNLHNHLYIKPNTRLNLTTFSSLQVYSCYWYDQTFWDPQQVHSHSPCVRLQQQRSQRCGKNDIHKGVSVFKPRRQTYISDIKCSAFRAVLSDNPLKGPSCLL